MVPYLSEGENAFLRPNQTALHHDKVIIHFTVVGEASLRGSVGIKKNGGFRMKSHCHLQ